MTDVLLSFLSRDYSGLLIALGLLAIAWLGYRRRGARPRRWFFGALGLLAIVLAIGAASHLARVRAIDAANPAPGKIVDVGGFDMHVLAEGPTGGPAVVWFPGGHSGGLGFYDQHRAVRDQVPEPDRPCHRQRLGAVGDGERRRLVHDADGRERGDSVTCPFVIAS